MSQPIPNTLPEKISNPIINIEQKLQLLQSENNALKIKLQSSLEKESLYQSNLEKIKSVQSSQENAYFTALKDSKRREEELKQKFLEFQKVLENQYSASEARFNEEMNLMNQEMNKKDLMINKLGNEIEKLEEKIAQEELTFQFKTKEFENVIKIKERKLEELNGSVKQITKEATEEIKRMSEQLEELQMKNKNNNINNNYNINPGEINDNNMGMNNNMVMNNKYMSDLKNENLRLKLENKNLKIELDKSYNELRFWKNKKNLSNTTDRKDTLKEIEIKQLKRTLTNYGNKIKLIGDQYNNYIIKHEREKKFLLNQISYLKNLNKQYINSQKIINTNKRFNKNFNNYKFNNYRSEINNINIPKYIYTEANQNDNYNNDIDLYKNINDIDSDIKNLEYPNDGIIDKVNNLESNNINNNLDENLNINDYINNNNIENNDNNDNNNLFFISDGNLNKNNTKENLKDNEKNKDKSKDLVKKKSRNRNYSEAFTIDSSNFLSERKKMNMKKIFNNNNVKITLTLDSYNKKQPKLKFGNFPINKKLVPRLKLYNNVIDKLIKEQKKICDDSKRNKIDNSLKKIDILSFDKYIEQNKSERHFLNKPKNLKFTSNYYEYINSEKYFPNSIRLKSKNKKIRYLSDEGISSYNNRKIE